MTGSRVILLLAALSLAPGGILRADLKAALNERDLGKRSKLALDNAAMTVKEARDAYQQGDTARLTAAASEIEESVVLAWDSLQSTGKNPRTNKWFKMAEIATRDLDKKLETLQHDLNFEDRALLEKARTRTRKVHDDLLNEVMGNKKQ